MAFQISVKAQAACDGCGRTIILREPVVKGELQETDLRPVSLCFGDKLAIYSVEVKVNHEEVCYVINSDILCKDCYRKYSNALKNIEYDASNKKRAIIKNIKAENGAVVGTVMIATGEEHGN